MFLRFGNICSLQCDISFRCTPPLLKYQLSEKDIWRIIIKYYSNDGMHDSCAKFYIKKANLNQDLWTRSEWLMHIHIRHKNMNQNSMRRAKLKILVWDMYCLKQVIVFWILIGCSSSIANKKRIIHKNQSRIPIKSIHVLSNGFQGSILYQKEWIYANFY